MDDTLLTLVGSVVPPRWRGTALALAAASPYIVRGLHALYCGKGLRGVMAGIWLGTNQPNNSPPPMPPSPTFPPRAESSYPVPPADAQLSTPAVVRPIMPFQGFQDLLAAQDAKDRAVIDASTPLGASTADAPVVRDSLTTPQPETKTQ
jgi:hypothetical protein